MITTWMELIIRRGIPALGISIGLGCLVTLALILVAKGLDHGLTMAANVQVTRRLLLHAAVVHSIRDPREGHVQATSILEGSGRCGHTNPALDDFQAVSAFWKNPLQRLTLLEVWTACLQASRLEPDALLEMVQKKLDIVREVKTRASALSVDSAYIDMNRTLQAQRRYSEQRDLLLEWQAILNDRPPHENPSGRDLRSAVAEWIQRAESLMLESDAAVLPSCRALSDGECRTKLRGAD